MKKENIPTELFDLLASKTYESLSNEEKNLVNSMMTSEEYKNLKDMVSDFQELDKDIFIQEDSFAVPVTKKSFLSRMLNYPIPAYQVAASLMVLIGLFFLMKPSLNNQDGPSMDSLVIDTTGISVAKDVYPDSLIFKL